mgnify:CR=1 FL=1
MKIVAISGSLRKASSNTAALRAAARLAPAGVHVAIRDGVGWETERVRRGATIGLGRALLSRLTHGIDWTMLSVNTHRPLFWFLGSADVTSMEGLRDRRLDREAVPGERAKFRYPKSNRVFSAMSPSLGAGDQCWSWAGPMVGTGGGGASDDRNADDQHPLDR